MVVELRGVRGGAVGPPAEGFEVAYTEPCGSELRRPLTDVWAVRFEDAAPVREFHSYKGQRHLPGLWWSSTAGRHVGYESWLERDHVMLLDFDAAVVGVSSQPFWLFWTGGNGKGVSHAPDYFARRDDGSAIVIDCRPTDRRKARDLMKFDATQAACDLLGWEFRLVGAPDPIRLANVRWLAGYRHPRHLLETPAAALREVFHEPWPLIDGACLVGDPITVLPVLFHLIWRNELEVELSVPLHARSLVHPGVR
ncbi:TnsA-like heteromeric transposase endonuclease subunit [Streptomyces sp. NPDC057428]|uniref:TnsA-like heteromeric transposase endonuclease subunit n=1 Tax=Streptomyces sp. NPDC057428 TaxID=3346129 RepID=UPI003685FC6B